MNIFAIPIFTDNYVWTLTEGSDAVLVDPGDAAPVLRELAARQLHLRAILITHWHPDHIGGLKTLCEKYPVPVYGPRAESARIPQLSHPLSEADTVQVLGHEFRVMETPGHTLGHIALFSGDILLCGDTLFSAGCGRLFEGTPQQMHTSLGRLALLADNTRVYCTHEYTAANVAFALSEEPDNPYLQAYAQQVRALRAQGRNTLPSSIGLEKRINPFLHCADVESFAALRKRKDIFKG